MMYIYRTGNRLAAVHAPLVDAAMEIKLQATTAHLWLEEIITGDKTESIDTVLKHIDEANWYANAMLAGGENEEGRFYPLKDPDLRTHTKEVQAKLAEFKRITRQRWETKGVSGIGSEIDQQYDAIFNDFITQVDRVETDIQMLIARDLKYFRAVQAVLMAVCVLVTLAAGKIFGNMLHTQIKNKEELRTSNQQLNAANQQLTANEQQLRAANQQLSANEQQLRAANQQLSANEQQLRAANQQLSANEQQLRAANQQLSANEQQLRAANQQLTASEQKYRDLFNQMTSGFATHEIICDDDGKPIDYRFLEINPAFEELTGLKAADIVGKTVLEVMPSTESHWIEIFGKVAITGESILFDNYSEVLKKHYHVNAFSHQKGFFAVIFNDVTKLKNAEIEQDKLNGLLEIKNKELQNVVYIASHDLRSPLVNIQGFSGELTHSCDELNNIVKKLAVDDSTKEQIDRIICDDIAECLKFIGSSSVSMQMQLDGLLQVSRVGTAELNIEKLDVNNVMENVLAAMEFQIQKSDAKIIVHDLLECLGDLRQTNQIFTNLLDNALKYSHPDRKGEITVTSETSDGMIHYYVKDNGIGVDKRHRDKVFEMFHRLNPSGEVKGHGLGLAIVKKMVHRQNGQISIESEEGVGCKFCVSLPKA
jgi:PAS domain S-box-containing protein